MTVSDSIKLTRLSLMLIAGVAVTGCSFLVDTESTQCSTDDDCFAFPGTTCNLETETCESSGNSGVCDGTLHLRMMLDATGPTSGVSIPYFKGEYDYVRELDELGGIRGCDIEVEYADYGYDTTVAQQIYEGWRDEPEWPEVTAVFGFGTGDTLQLAPLATEDKKVLISASYSGDIASPIPVSGAVSVPEITAAFVETSFNENKESTGYPYNFFAGTDYSTGARIAMFYVNSMAGKRVGFFHCTAAYCTSPLAAAKVHATEALGMDIGRDLIIELTDDEATIEAKVLEYFQEELDYKNGEGDWDGDPHPEYDVVDWVWMGNTTGTNVSLGKALTEVENQLGLSVQIIVNNWGFDEDLFSLCGEDCVGRVHGIMPFIAYGDLRASGMEDMMSIHDKWRERDIAAGTEDAGTTHENVRYVQGYVSAHLWRLGIEALIDSGRPVSGEELKAALETLDNVSTGGLSAPLSFSSTDHRPQSTESIYMVDDQGNLVHEPPDREIFLEDNWLGW